MTQGEPDVLDVAAGVILDPSGDILIARRAGHLHQGGLWEFPGGKLELGETPRQALERELFEELAIRVEEASPLITLTHDYSDRRVCLHVWRVERFSGTPRGMQDQPIAWVPKSSLADFSFPAANRPIVTAARLPDRYAILDLPSGREQDFLESIEAYADRGIDMIRLRASGLPGNYYAMLAYLAAGLCKDRGISLLLNASAPLLRATGAAGLHLRSDELMSLAERPVGPECWVAASCHDEMQLQHASQIGVDFAVLGPVLATATHPEARPLGWEKFAQMVRLSTVPVFALGGLSEQHLIQAKRQGAQGISAIRGLL